MHDRITKRFGSLHRQWRWIFLTLVAITGTCFLVTAAAFSYHVYKTISRYTKHEILQSSITKQNQTLYMPVVSLTLNTIRNTESKGLELSMNLKMKFEASLDNKRLPEWAFIELPDLDQQYITANAINKDVLNVNFTLEDAKHTVFLKKSKK